MAKPREQNSIKRLAINKANTSLIVIIAISVFVIIFSLVANKALFSQMKYQAKVISKKQKTLNLIEANQKEVETLNQSYKEFSSQVPNIIGGNPTGDGDRDGENARIILDALPSKYDYPALLTGLNKLVQSGGYKLTSITGTDDEITQGTSSNSSAPQPVDMPFSLEAIIPQSDGGKFLQLFERSIRPIQIGRVTIQGKSDNLSITIQAKTYFQPEKKLNIKEEIVR